VIVLDEYLAVRVIAGDWPSGLPDDDDLALPAARHWRLLQRIHAPAGGQLSQRLAALPATDIAVLRNPHPEVLHILDPRPLLDDAAVIAARHHAGGLLVAETLAAGLVHGRQLWFGHEHNIGRRLADVADQLDIAIHAIT
jgi:hypothetical protein